MVHAINYKEKFEKELYKLYCKFHNQPFDYDIHTCIEKLIPAFNSFKIKLLKIDDSIRGFIFYKHTSTDSENNILDVVEVYIDKKYACQSNYVLLLGSIKKKGILTRHYKFARLQFQNSDARKEELISCLGLEFEKKVFDMKIELVQRIEIPENNNVVFIPFKKGTDEMKRAKIQNSIFKDTIGHIDCDTSDILFEEKQDYYIEDGSTFLSINGNIAGYSQIILEKSPTSKPYIVNFGIDKNYRNMGLSKQLLYHTLQILKQKGFGKAYITVDSDNYKAYNLYKKSGFEKVTTMVSYLYKY